MLFRSILGVQELLLKSQEFAPHEKSLLKSANTSAKSLLGILNQVLDLSKIEAGKLTLNLEPCCLNSLIDDISAAFSTVAYQQNLTLHILKDPQIAGVLMIDALRLRQILQNLISNAIKFTKQGEIYFSITVLADDHAGQLIEFRVIDTGVGMGADEIELALQAFEQLPGNGGQEQGTGLGLTITNHLVRSMNSHLYFESAPDLGSNIHFCVAFSRTSLAPLKSEHPSSERSISTKLMPKKSQVQRQQLLALVVEDHPASRQIISLQLETLGIKTWVCDHADQALAMISENDFDLLVTDQSIPGMQGSELAQQVRSMGLKDMVIIGITADIYALDSRHQFLSAGMNGVLIKPLSLLALENELTRHFPSTPHSKDSTTSGDYCLESLSRTLKTQPDQVNAILNEITKVHEEALEILSAESLENAEVDSLIHKIKGGAQLLNAKEFLQACEELEQERDLARKCALFKNLLVEQNRHIACHQKQDGL